MAYDKVVDSSSLDAELKDIADAIRAKTGGTDALSLDQMAMEIAGIQAAPVLQERTITENGTYTPDEGVDGFDKVTVDVESTGGVNINSANVYEITVGVNSITTAYDASNYIFGFVKNPAYILLNSSPDTNNQIVAFGPSNSDMVVRYRSGVTDAVASQPTYSAELVEGSIYTVFEYGR